MRYSESLVKEILAELEKIPVIRQVCAKVNIDHSTFYRWMILHPTFHSRATLALHLGRKRVSDGAESVVIGGVQNKEPWAARFWLTHNEPRYMSLHKGRHHNELISSRIDAIEKHMSSDQLASFDKVFTLYDYMEKNYEPELVTVMMRPIIELLCLEDPKLVDVFNAAYANWKKDNADLKKKVRAVGIEPEEIDEKDAK